MAGLGYVSTRGGGGEKSFSEVALDGLAADGGLMLPRQITTLTPAELAAWRPLGYADLAKVVLAKFIDDIEAPALAALLEATYTPAIFGDAQITPLTMLTPELGLLHLSNGPTLAFKDLAMQWLGALFDYLLARRKEHLNILGATSGDTGSAALSAMRGRARIRVFMLSPAGRMSPFQAAQMYSIDDPNCINLAVRGVFDQAQDIVKAINQDASFKALWHIGTVNSINWARLVAQVVYYFKGYFAATQHDHERVSFCVPSGNFGNIYAGHVARRMGLPIEQLVCATNENDVLDEFFRTGCYRARALEAVHATSSPSMDISRASNFERLMYDAHGADAQAVVHDWQRLRQDGAFRVSASVLARIRSDFGFVSGVSTHADRLATIRSTYRQYQRFVDPHTADGLSVAWRYISKTPMLVLETAQPAKFEATMREALGFTPPRPVQFLGLEQRPQRVQEIDASEALVRAAICAQGVA